MRNTDLDVESASMIDSCDGGQVSPVLGARPQLNVVTVIIPALNEEQSLPLVLRDLPEVGRVIVANNGSTVIAKSGSTVTDRKGANVYAELGATVTA